MQSFMNTILSALKLWVKKLIKSSTPDWNQNDENGDGYIKNRPFYAYGENVVVMREATVSSQNSQSQLEVPLIVGTTYVVTFDGVQYETVCRDYSGYRMLGNNAIYEYDDGIMEDTGEPFALEEGSGSLTLDWYFQDDDSAEHTVSIDILGREVKELSEEFFPDTIARKTDIPAPVQPDWEQNDPAAPDYVKNRTHYDAKYVVGFELSDDFHSRYESLSFQDDSGNSPSNNIVSYMYFKISDLAPSLVEIMETGKIMSGNELKDISQIGWQVLFDTEDYYSIGVNTRNSYGLLFVALKAGAIMTLGHAGVTQAYTAAATSPGIYVAVKRSDYSTSFEHLEWGNTVPLDEKYIPDTIARKSDVAALSKEIEALCLNKVSLPVSDEGVGAGTAGQFAVSDGMGGIMWKNLVEAEEVSY